MLYMDSKGFRLNERYDTAPKAECLVDPSGHGVEVFETSMLSGLDPGSVLGFSRNVNSIRVHSALNEVFD